MVIPAALVTVLVAVLVRAMLGPPATLAWQLVAWALFAAAVWAARRVPGRPLTALVVAGGIAVTATGLAAPPSTSSDSYRYAWDGRVQAAGISPYDHAPADPALAPLRDAWLFPGGHTRINRPTVHTIYPPVAQVYFLAVHRVSPEGSRHKVLQLGGAVLAVLTLLLLCRFAGARRAAYWAWCPAVPVEAVNNAHVDMLGVLLVVLAFCVVRGRGALLGAAVAAKLLPAVTLPGALSGVLRDGVDVRRVLRIVVPAGLVAGLAYLPYVLASRGSVVGYLFGYVAEEGYETPAARDRYALLKLVLPDAWAPFAAIAALALVVLYVLRHGDERRPWSGALVVTGALFLLFTPGYSWYALLLVALVALDGRWEWLGVAAAGAVAYLAGPATLAYGVAALAAGAGWLARRSSASRKDWERPATVPSSHGADRDHR
ncbi:glycosyltransferase 87 family protein [Nonomuraea sp. SBT364]|uniref:glycosyltransferase 87 family protein n=1 Tax=Nonomuraea sp. SBT364 TaxID=1580530 RepID=UPI0009EA74B9|nr:glycosyltransferase 87 family protein [Nonomuraea sp. SBT364]